MCSVSTGHFQGKLSAIKCSVSVGHFQGKPLSCSHCRFVSDEHKWAFTHWTRTSPNQPPLDCPRQGCWVLDKGFALQTTSHLATLIAKAHRAMDLFLVPCHHPLGVTLRFTSLCLYPEQWKFSCASLYVAEHKHGPDLSHDPSGSPRKD